MEKCPHCGQDIVPETANISDARLIIDFLNKKTGKHYRYAGTNLRPIMSILKSGVSIDDIKRVIAFKIREWSGTDYEKYLRPETLFRASKFESYLGQLGWGEDEKN